MRGAWAVVGKKCRSIAMSRTRRRRKHVADDPAKVERDGRGSYYGVLPSRVFVTEVRRRDRRERDAETGKLERDAADADDTALAPKPRAKWQFWRSWG